jgi:hypothetical protein
LSASRFSTALSISSIHASSASGSPGQSFAISPARLAMRSLSNRVSSWRRSAETNEMRQALMAISAPLRAPSLCG